MTPLSPHMFLDEAVLKEPNRFYRQLAEEAPVWRVGASDVFTVNSHAGG